MSVIGFVLSFSLGAWLELGLSVTLTLRVVREAAGESRVFWEQERRGAMRETSDAVTDVGLAGHRVAVWHCDIICSGKWSDNNKVSFVMMGPYRLIKPSVTLPPPSPQSINPCQFWLLVALETMAALKWYFFDRDASLHVQTVLPHMSFLVRLNWSNKVTAVIESFTLCFL